MSYTNHNVISLIAKAIKMKKGDIEGDIASQDAAYKAESTTFEAARQAAQSAFDTSYSNKEAAKADLEAEALKNALEAVTVARDAIVVDDNAPAVVDTLAEMEAQINAELTAFTSQQAIYEASLSSDRDDIEKDFGSMADYSDSVNRSYTTGTVVS